MVSTMSEQHRAPIIKNKLEGKPKKCQKNKNKKLTSKIKNKINRLKQALKDQAELKNKLRSCSKHLQNLQQKDEDEFMTINEIYESYGAFGTEETNKYEVIDDGKVYDDPMAEIIIQIFEDEGKVTVKKLMGVLENEYEEIEMNYYEVIDEIADLVDSNTYEDIDDEEHLYDYIDRSKLAEIKGVNQERKQIQSTKRTVKTIIQNLNALDQEKLMPLEDIYAIPNKIERQNDGNASISRFAVDEASSVYVKQAVKEKFGDQKHGRVRDLINFFEGKKMNLDEKQDTIIRKMTRMVEEEAKGLEKVMVENEVYEQFNNSDREPDAVFNALKQMNSDAVVSLENMKLTTKKGKMLNNAPNIKPDEENKIKEMIRQKYGEVGEISVEELLELFNKAFKPNYDQVIKEMSKGASMKATSENLNDK